MTTFCVYGISRQEMRTKAERLANRDLNRWSNDHIKLTKTHRTELESLAYFAAQRDAHMEVLFNDASTKPALMSGFYSSPDRCAEFIELAKSQGARSLSVYCKQRIKVGDKMKTVTAPYIKPINESGAA